ncbi:hypothetical protein DZK27_13875 [Rhodobacteraceae bacterium 63075]|nr:hypothetical protein DZK27_13875 [Rhodobacteraceae bacterium 63075]
MNGSLCVGFDCVNGESFGFDTIRMKENNTRIKFQDTSSSASFPTVDWQLTANESTNGGLNKFSIDDVDAGRTPFTIEANTRSHQLYLADNNKVGFGTATPSVDLHVKQGNTPTLRLEQDGSSGFAAQTWDIAGNETNFFVRDASNGSQLPLRIFPGADSNSLVVGANNHVGMGAGTSPDAPLHVQDDEAVTLALFEGDGVKVIDVKSTDDNAVQVRMQTDSTNRRFVALNAAGSPQSQVIFGDNEVKIAGTNDSSNLFATFSPAGIITDIGTCTTASPCDAVFDPEVYTVPSIEDHANAMWANKYLPAIGPTRNGPTNVNAKLTGMINELEHAHIYIDQLNSRVKELEAMLADLQ